MTKKRIRRRTKTQLERIYEMEIDIEIRKQKEVLDNYKKEKIKEFHEIIRATPPQELVADWTDDSKCVQGSTISSWYGNRGININLVADDNHPIMIEYQEFLDSIQKQSDYIKKTRETALNKAQEHTLKFLKDKDLEVPKLKIRAFKLKK